jgi:hypothetical protein
MAEDTKKFIDSVFFWYKRFLKMVHKKLESK